MVGFGVDGHIYGRTTSCTHMAGDALKLMDDTERARAHARIYIHTYTCTMSVRASLIDLGIVMRGPYKGVLLISLLRVTSPSHH